MGNETLQKQLFPTLPEAGRPFQGKDELNIAEFPLSSLAHRIPEGVKTLEFADKTWDEGAKELVTRKLTITAADKYGLPTAIDDEVVLALIQLSKMQGFQSKSVTFTRYQIIKILGWHDVPGSYRRVKESLNRWLGVTLQYENAWWDKEEKVWKNEGFHILDRLTTVKDEHSGAKKEAFVWNDLIFKSFQSGNLKNLNLEDYRQLKRAVSKRLYRFLDKRFFQRAHWKFDVFKLAHDKLGLSRQGNVAEVKRKLLPAIQELERIGFIDTMPPSKRFYKVAVGQWEVIFTKATSQKKLEIAIDGKAEDISDIEASLIKYGVSKKAIHYITNEYPEDYIRHKIEVMEYITSQGKAPRETGGFLVKSMQEDYADPKGFVSAADLEKQSKEKQMRLDEYEAKQRKKEEREREKQEAQAKEEAATRVQIDSYMAQLSKEEQQTIIETAYRVSTEKNPIFGKHLAQEGDAGGIWHDMAISAYVLQLLEKG